MIQVRNKLFETNSSSTHSLVITTNDEWIKFMNNEMLIDLYSGELIPITDKNKDNYPHKKIMGNGNSRVSFMMSFLTLRQQTIHGMTWTIFYMMH